MANTTPQSKRALIVIDVQNEYVTGKLRIAYPEIATSLANIARAMDAAKAAGIPIAVVQHLAPENAPIFVRGSEGAALHQVVSERPYDLLVEKNRASALTDTNLGAWLKENEIDTLTIVGYMTHNCVHSTVLEATFRGWKVEVLSDACGSLPYANAAGSATAEEIHRVFTIVMHTGFAAVTSTQEWLVAAGKGDALMPDNIYLSNQRALKQGEA